MPTQYVGTYGTDFKTKINGRTVNLDLLWGDPVHTLGNGTMFARGFKGTPVNPGDLVPTDPKLLELYVIDVGQGDALLFKTPNGKWHLIDAGVSNEKQQTRKGAANFLRWKFLSDLRKRKVDLENVIISHPDSDHFGGLLNLLGGILPAYGIYNRDRTFNVSVKNFYHNGMGRFKTGAKLGAKESGRVAPFLSALPAYRPESASPQRFP